MASSLHNVGGDEADHQGWFMDLEDVPETPIHAEIIRLLIEVLEHRFRADGAMVTTNLGCRWDPNDARVGIDPDVVLLDPAPPEGLALSTLRVWLPQHAPPRLGIEVVSAHTADKDYLNGPARMTRLGAGELWIFDPFLCGPSTGTPFRLQIWRRAEVNDAELVQIHAGEAPAYSPALDAWVVTTHDGQRLRLAEDPRGACLWPTRAEAEAERAQAEATTRESEAARADAAEQEVRRLRALLDKQK